MFNPGDVHSCEQSGEGLLAYDSVAVDAEILDGARLIGPKVSSCAAVAAFRDAIRAIDARDEAIAREHVLRLCGLLLSREFGRTPVHAHDEAAMRMMTHFCGNLARPRTLEELAKEEGLSKFALIRAYRSQFAITPMKHLSSLRVECASKLLRGGVEPAVVAAEVGFADQAHLTRAFKQRMGVTPGAYQRMVRKGDGRS